MNLGSVGINEDASQLVLDVVRKAEPLERRPDVRT